MIIKEHRIKRDKGNIELFPWWFFPLIMRKNPSHGLESERTTPVRHLCMHAYEQTLHGKRKWPFGSRAHLKKVRVLCILFGYLFVCMCRCKFASVCVCVCEFVLVHICKSTCVHVRVTSPDERVAKKPGENSNIICIQQEKLIMNK